MYFVSLNKHVILFLIKKRNSFVTMKTNSYKIISQWLFDKFMTGWWGKDCQQKVVTMTKLHTWYLRVVTDWPFFIAFSINIGNVERITHDVLFLKEAWVYLEKYNGIPWSQWSHSLQYLYHQLSKRCRWPSPLAIHYLWAIMTLA